MKRKYEEDNENEINIPCHFLLLNVSFLIQLLSSETCEQLPVKVNQYKSSQ